MVSLLLELRNVWTVVGTGCSGEIGRLVVVGFFWYGFEDFLSRFLCHVGLEILPLDIFSCFLIDNFRLNNLFRLVDLSHYEAGVSFALERYLDMLNRRAHLISHIIKDSVSIRMCWTTSTQMEFLLLKNFRFLLIFGQSGLMLGWWDENFDVLVLDLLLNVGWYLGNEGFTICLDLKGKCLVDFLVFVWLLGTILSLGLPKVEGRLSLLILAILRILIKHSWLESFLCRWYCSGLRFWSKRPTCQLNQS